MKTIANHITKKTLGLALLALVVVCGIAFANVTKGTFQSWMIFQDGAFQEELYLDQDRLRPGSDGGLDLGSSSYSFNNATIDGTATINAIAASTLTMAGALYPSVEQVTTSSALLAYGTSELDGTTANGAGAAITLGSASITGELKTVSMQEATTSFTLTVALHADGDASEFLFDAVDESLTLQWTGTEWETIKWLNSIVPGTLTVAGATTLAGALDLNAAANIQGALTLQAGLVRTSQEYCFNVGFNGASAGWITSGTTNISQYLLPASEATTATLIMPITGLHVGDTITGWKLVGQIESAGNTVELDGDLRKTTTVATGNTDASVGAIVGINVVADTALATEKTGLTEVVAATETFYVLLSGTTAGSTDIAIQGITVTVTTN